MALKLVDIDDRLIHGQVATTWIPDFDIESAIIVSDKVANDPVQKSVAGLAAPDIKVSVFGVEKFIEVLKKTELKKATMVLFTNPIDALKLHENGLPFDYLNVSGMRFNEQRHRLHKNMSVTAEEKAAFEELIGLGVDCWMQTTTRDSKKATMVLFTNPIDALKLHENGLPFDYLNVSGMRFNEQRHRLHKNMSVTAEEKAAFEELIGLGVDCWMQTTTRDSKEPVSELLKNY